MMMQKLFLLCLVSSLIGAAPIGGADRLIGVQSARVMSQSMPWIAARDGDLSQVQFGISVGLHRHFAAGYGGDVGR